MIRSRSAEADDFHGIRSLIGSFTNDSLVECSSTDSPRVRSSVPDLSYKDNDGLEQTGQAQTSAHLPCGVRSTRYGLDYYRVLCEVLSILPPYLFGCARLARDLEELLGALYSPAALRSGVILACLLKTADFVAVIPTPYYVCVSGLLHGIPVSTKHEF